MRRILPLLACVLLLCPPLPAAELDPVGEAYVRLVLAVGEHDPAYVDAYYGPPEWREQAREAGTSLPEIAAEARRLAASLPETAGATPEILRVRYLKTQLAALAAWAADRAEPGARDFQREALAYYDTAPPLRSHSEFDPVLAELDRLLPGEGPLHARVAAFNRRYEIPRERLPAVFEAAIAECRERTRRHIALPPQESFAIEYVSDQPWSGYNWYQGDARSLIQVNTDLPVRIDRAIDLGCHEGYPGHHTYNALLEAELVRRRGWVEFSVYALFSPQSVIAEGSANYGIALAFPGREKLAFEKRVLYPLAGLDPAAADLYDRVQQLSAQLDFARNETARRYIDGDIDREQAIALLQTYGPSSRERAEQSLRFIERYGAYVINYNWGRELVRRYVEAGTRSAAQRWEKFAGLLASPRLPSSLAAD
jgi:hypothetical protein